MLTATMTRGTGLNVFHHHRMQTYLNWMNAQSNIVFDGFHKTIGGGIPALVTINSPVDVAIYNNQGDLVGEIINNVAKDMPNSDVASFVVDGSKHVFLPYGNTYTIKFTGTGNGTMKYIIEAIDVLYSTPQVVRTFEDVLLYAGREMVSVVGRTIDIPDVQLFISEDNVVVGEIAEDGTETRFPVPRFIDVAFGNWFYPYVRFVYGQGVMQGTTSTTFAPSTNFSRNGSSDTIPHGAWRYSS